MKTRIFAAALAVLSVLSCQKEEQQVIDNTANAGANLITCTFAANEAATKTTLEGMTPKWAAGDEIVLYNSGNDTLHLTLASSGEPSSTQGIIDESDATKFTFARPDGWENVYAIYPSSAYVNSFKLKFSEQDGTFAKANICAAVEISQKMSFKNVGAILKFPSKPEAVTNITIKALGSVKTNYSISFNGATPSLTPTDSRYLWRGYTISSGTDAVYIGVPPCTISEGSAFIYRDASCILGSYLTGAENTTEANNIYTLPAIEANGKLPGIFTVASGKQVQFSKGNLQATCTATGAEGTSTYSWAFAEHQYDYVGNKPGNTSIASQTLTSKVDLFGWVGASGTLTGEATKYGISTSTTGSDYGNNASDALKADWGTTIDNNGTWRTLSSAEWTYLLNTSGSSGRSDANRFAKANVNSVKGLIIFPDGYNGGSVISGITGIAAVNRVTAPYPVQQIDDWTSMESDGCVFLPAAGYRSNGAVTCDSEGCYWSSTSYDSNNAYRMSFSSGSVNDASNYQQRNYGFSVRLVSAAK